MATICFWPEHELVPIIFFNRKFISVVPALGTNFERSTELTGCTTIIWGWSEDWGT